MDSDLSGGEKQKISVIRAFLKDSQILLLDEPSNHLDKKSVDILSDYISETNKTVILVSHDLSLLKCMDKYIEI